MALRIRNNKFSFKHVQTIPYEKTLILIAVLVATLQTTMAQTTKEANPADVATLDGIMKAVYDVISGDAGKARDWDRFRSLFQKDAV